ncbi:MAG: class E sortase [Actinobacteria bacterium]|jgi:sortase A|nr:MAG: class E sortase [Actinomycetota bacterium]
MYLDRAVYILAVALITAGLVVLADVGLTLVWQEPASSIYASVRQHDAESALNDLEQHFPGPADRKAIRGIHGERKKVSALARLFAQRVSDGQAIGRIVIPSIGVDIVVVQGTSTGDLTQGPGHYPQTPFPGQPGTAAIAGHRTTYLAPFRHLDGLDGGDQIELRMPYATLDYRVQRTKVVQPTDLGILHPTGYQRLVLTACHPLYSASERIVAFARLQRVALTSG